MFYYYVSLYSSDMLELQYNHRPIGVVKSGSRKRGGEEEMSECGRRESVFGGVK